MMRRDRPPDSNLGQPLCTATLFNAIEGNNMSEQVRPEQLMRRATPPR